MNLPARKSCRSSRDAAILALLLLPQAAAGQFLERPVVIQNARIIRMNGPVIERGSIRIKGRVIEDVGVKVDVPLLARTFDAAGKTVTPGIIDAHSSLGMTSGGAANGDATADAFDAFDRYAIEDFRDALRNGVTTVYLSAASAAGINGRAAVIQLARGVGGDVGAKIERDDELCIDLASERSATARLNTYRSVRKAFQDALDYRTAKEEYEEALKEYEKKLKERAEKEAEQEKKTEAEKKEPPKEGQKDPSGGKGKPAAAVIDAPTVAGSPPVADAAAAQPTGMVAAQGPDAAAGFQGQPPKTDKPPNDKEKKEEEIKKPEEPKPDRSKERLLQAIDREFSVRIRADRSADILNALSLADEFGLKIVIEGAAEAAMVAQALADARVPVVLGQAQTSPVDVRPAWRNVAPQTAAALTRAGVKWGIGTGAGSAALSRFTLVNAQAAAAWIPGEDALRRVTIDAADLLGLDRRIGHLTPGMQADLVVWTGDPGDPASKVERVYVAGKLVYQDGE
ncbi:MAG: hypothetical protein C4547_01435 [Phycisphaerales bacterium]|nr:MAG: hypothetical protein C4547_01435 [Phycisphaerales bacterium]